MQQWHKAILCNSGICIHKRRHTMKKYLLTSRKSETKHLLWHTTLLHTQLLLRSHHDKTTVLISWYKGLNYRHLHVTPTPTCIAAPIILRIFWCRKLCCTCRISNNDSWTVHLATVLLCYTGPVL